MPMYTARPAPSAALNADVPVIVVSNRITTDLENRINCAIITGGTDYSREVKENNIMAKKSALQKIEDHEKLCRIMQKQTFEQIKEIKERVTRMERMIMGGGGAIILALIMNMIQ